jgi:hypothetical protein
MPARKHFVTSSPGPHVAVKAARAAARLGSAGALALLLSASLWTPGVAAAQTSPSLSGTWQMSCPTQRGVRQVVLHIVQSGPKLSGSFTGPRRSGKLSGNVHGSQITLKMGRRFRSVSFTGTIQGNSMAVRSPKGVSCSASRE